MPSFIKYNMKMCKSFPFYREKHILCVIWSPVFIALMLKLMALILQSMTQEKIHQ